VCVCVSCKCDLVCVVCVCGVCVCVVVCIEVCRGDGCVEDTLLALDRLYIFVLVCIVPGTSTMFDSNFIISDLILLSLRCLDFILWVWGWVRCAKFLLLSSL